MKQSAIIRNAGFTLCVLSVFSPIFMMWQLKEVVAGALLSSNFSPGFDLACGGVVLFLGVTLFNLGRSLAQKGK
jgi:hypothetical protein